jgi:ABC-type ATPase with predicted acetyltransferase domain
MRTDIARALCLGQDLVVFDEWTSVVDREVAKIASYAVSKAIRRSKKKFVAVTCHYDVIDWLEPDWVFCTDNMEFVKKTKAPGN